ncbi:hypothetical protein D9615_001215 [Tricholomella constricta]|uniref:Uncharacterized protein n=1 Tax=Tricholomella constricta TaxID=117010 RepID=A0A8H5HL02_9AGAR|nr:hypothetical protein D9615_001215 [Tricholomella constricta]
MDTRVRRAVVSTAGFLFAFVGFSLSVLAILFAMLTPTLFAEAIKPPASAVETLERRRARQSHVAVKPSSENLSPPPLLPSTLRKTEVIPKVTTANHDQQRTLPLPPPQSTYPIEDILLPSLKRKPTAITFAQDIGLASLPASSSKNANPTLPERVLIPSECEDGRAGFKLSNLKPLWGEKQPKLSRCVSSPHLASKAPLSMPAREGPRKPCKPSSLGKKRSKPLSKETEDLPTSRSVSCPVAPADKKPMEKKKSLILRTQPYEAPYFFPHPIPPISDTEASKRRKPARSRTLPPRHRSTSPSPTPGSRKLRKATIMDGSLAPPRDYHIAPIRPVP